MPRDRLNPLKGILAQQTDELLNDDEQVEQQIIYQDREVPVPYDLAYDDKTGGVVIGRFTISRRGLIIADGVTEEEWRQFGNVIVGMRDSLALMIGDWLAHGELKYGVSYSQFVEAFGLDDQTLYDYKWVCGSVEFSLRKENLFYNHYKAVAKLSHEAKVYWLERASIGDGTEAEPKRWSTRRLEAEISGLKLPRPKVEGSVHLLQFERKYNPFMEGVSKIASKADPIERRQMAEYLRSLADRVERGQ